MDRFRWLDSCCYLCLGDERLHSIHGRLQICPRWRTIVPWFWKQALQARWFRSLISLTSQLPERSSLFMPFARFRVRRLQASVSRKLNFCRRNAAAREYKITVKINLSLTGRLQCIVSLG